MIQEESKKGNINSRLDNCVSSLDIQAREDKKQQEIIRLMPEIKKRSALVSENESSFEAGIFCRGFVEGAEWRINSVWHDIKEMPENNRMILIIMQYDIPTVLGPDNSFFAEEVKDRQIQRWAYIDDLLSKKEE